MNYPPLWPKFPFRVPGLVAPKYYLQDFYYQLNVLHKVEPNTHRITTGVHEPTQSELNVVARLFPGEDPESPPWAQVRVLMIEKTGWTPSEIERLSAPEIIMVLDGAKLGRLDATQSDIEDQATPAAPKSRNKLWVEWSKEMQGKNIPGRIRDRWNTMADDERAEYPPSDKIPTNEKGWDRVRKVVYPTPKRKAN
jgi:hypothetical protein